MRSFRVLRLLLDVPLKELAEIAGLSDRELRRIESGHVAPSPESLRKIDAAFLQCLDQRAARARSTP